MSVAEGSLAVLRELHRYCTRLAGECEARASHAHGYERGRDVLWFQGQGAGARQVQREVERLAQALKDAAEGGIQDNGNNRGRATDRAGR